MPTSTQFIRDILFTQPSAAAVLQRLDIDLRMQAEMPLEEACAELQLSLDQSLENLSDVENLERGDLPAYPSGLSTSRLIQHIVRVNHQRVHHELSRLSDQDDDRAPELKGVEALVEEQVAGTEAHQRSNRKWRDILALSRHSVTKVPAMCFWPL